MKNLVKGPVGMETEFRVILLQLLSDYSVTNDIPSFEQETIPQELSSPVSEKRPSPSEPVENEDDQDDDFFYGCFLKKNKREKKKLTAYR